MSELPQIREIGRNEFHELVDSIHRAISSLPNLNYDELHTELRESDYLHIPISADPSLDELSAAALKVQTAKDRVGQILLDAERNYKILKHYSKAIYIAWIRLSGDASQDRRESDATTRTWDFAGEAAQAETLYSASRAVLDNLKDKWDTISRNVSIIELRLKLGEIGGHNPTDRINNSSSFSPSSREIPGADLLDWENPESDEKN